MKEKAMNKDEILCRNMVVLTLCATVLGTAFYFWEEAKKTGGEKAVLVYELGWPDEEEGRAVFRKERYYLDEETGQPRMIEKYSSYDPNGEYVLDGAVIIERPKGGQEAGQGQ